MLALIDEELADHLNLDELETVVKDLGIGLKSYYCQVNRAALDITEFSKWSIAINEKIIVITSKPIIANLFLELQASYNGMVDSIGGSIAIVSLNEDSGKRWNYICLHEILHLHGVKHCETKRCIMAVMMCKCGLKYCAVCPEPCGEIQICEKCKGVIND